MSCKYCDGSGIPYGDITQEFCVFENHGHPEIAIPVGSNASVRANIDYCPKCGRYLKGNEKVDTKNYDLDSEGRIVDFERKLKDDE